MRYPAQGPVVIKISSNSDLGKLMDWGSLLQLIIIPATEAILDLLASIQPLTAAPPATMKYLCGIAISDGFDIEEQSA